MRLTSKSAPEAVLIFTERDVEKARDNRTPANTTKHTSWSSNVYRKWAEARNKEFIDFTGENQQFKRVPNFEDLSIKEINYWLSRLSLEVRKRDGGEYRHEVLYSLFCGLNRSNLLNRPLHRAI